MTTHFLKTEPIYFEEIWLGFKKFELRKNDRDFNVGDRLLLKEYEIGINKYSGREIIAEITYLLPSYHDALNAEYCIMSIKVISLVNGKHVFNI